MTPPPKKVAIYRIHFKMLYITPYFLSSRKSDSLSQFKKKLCSSSFNTKMCPWSFQPALANRSSISSCSCCLLLPARSRGYSCNYPNNAVLVVICPLSSLIESHVQELFFVDVAVLVARSLRSQKNVNKNNLWHLGKYRCATCNHMSHRLSHKENK